MSLAVGTRLGPYEIRGLIGAGGMGVVYRAYDERLQRFVAVKIIGESDDSPPEERDRLLGEARAASALNHPHICTVFEVGEFQSRPFIVMEYVEGRPLAEMVPHDGFPPETTTRYGVQIADALAHAHDRGVIHRDLKTANVVVNANGAAKILDFGLAQRVHARADDRVTGSVRGGEAGELAGTISYMPPEALLGQAADARSDIWSLGVVLYEIATGRLPFGGRNSIELTAAILRSPPEPFPAHVPPALRTVIARCLAKEPLRRYQYAGEVRAALEAIASDIAPVAIAPLRRRRPWATAASAVLLLGGVALIAWLLLRERDPDWEQFATGRRLTRVIASDERLSEPALSRDGRMICYVQQTADGRTDIYAGRTVGGARIRLTDDEAVERSPRFSPDGEFVAFVRTAIAGRAPEIRVVPSLGGDVVSTIPGGSFPAWSPDGARLAYVRRAQGENFALVVSARDGSSPVVILPSDSVYLDLRNPAWSPDGRHVAVVRSTGGAAGEIWLIPAAGGTPRRLREEPAATFSEYPVFTPDGRGIVHASNRGGATNLWVLPLGGGAPVRLTTGPGPDESPSVASDGSISFLNSRWRSLLQAYDDENATVRTLVTHAPFVWGPAVSPDGQEVAFSRSEVDGSWHVWLVAIGGGSPRRLTAGEGGELYPRWSADSASLLFHTWNVPRKFGRVVRSGGAIEWLRFGGEEHDSFADPSPDGRQVAFVRADAATERVYVVPAGGGPSRLLTTSPATVPKWSPDGRQIAFSGNRYVSGGIFTINADGTGLRQLAREGGWPVWWPDGNQIGYLALDANGHQQLRVVSSQGGEPRPLTYIKLLGVNHPFDVARNGRTIVVSNSEHISDEIWLLERKD